MFIIYIPDNIYDNMSHLTTDEYVGQYIKNPNMLKDLLEYAPIEVAQYYKKLIKQAYKIFKKTKE